MHTTVKYVLYNGKERDSVKVSVPVSVYYTTLNVIPLVDCVSSDPNRSCDQLSVEVVRIISK